MTEVTNRPVVEVGDVRSPLTGAALTRRPADARDSAFVRDLFAESRDDLWLLPSDTRDVIIDMQFRAQRRAWRLEFPAARQEILLVKDLRAGHALVAEDYATVDLVDLAVRPGLRGLGIGRALVDQVVADADRTHRATRVRVWSANHGARRFFERSGFVVGGVVAGYHELVRPAVDAVA